jgi:integrase
MPIYKQTDDGPWWASIHTKGKGRIRVSLRTRDRTEAEERYKILERKAWVEGCHGLVQAAPLTPQVVLLQDVYDRAIQTHYADAKDLEGVHGRWDTLTRFIDPGIEVKDITTSLARDTFLAMKAGTWTRGPNGTPRPYSAASVNRCMALLGKLLHFAHAEMDGAISVVPKMPKGSEAKGLKRRALRPDEFVQAVNALECHPIPSWRACADLLRVLWGTGCRVGELMPKQFAWAQVDFDNESLHWADTKSGHAVAKPMTADVRAVLKARKDAGLKAPFSDTNQDALRAAWDWVRTEVLKIEDPEERARVVPHSIRHAAATRILRAVNSATKTQKLMGHKSFLTTQRYEHMEVDDLRDAVEALRAPPGLPKR